MTSRTQDTKRRRRLTAEERRRAILTAAQDVFAGRGYHGSSIDEIAQAAGISKALIYEHFPSKRDLHASLLDAHAQELFTRLAQSAATDDPGEVRLRAGVDAFFGWVDERRGAFRMLFRDAVEPEVAGVLERLQRQAAATVAALIATEPAAARVREDEAERRLRVAALAQLLTGAVQSLALWWDDHQEVPRAALVDHVLEFAWLGLERLRAGERVNG